MSLLLLALTGLSAGAAIASDWHRRHPAFFVLKPLTTLLVITLAVVSVPSLATEYARWLLAGLILCLVGDVCLLSHASRWFLAGLSAFLLGHLAFVVALLDGLEHPAVPWWALLLLGGLPLVVPILRGAGRLKPAVAIYMAVLVAMVLAASARFQELGGWGPLLGLVGALLFLVSDSVLGLRRFVAPQAHLQPVILSTYWAAISLLALSS